MLLGNSVFMRTTVDIPEPLFRKTKATAALRGSTLRALIVHAIEKEVDAPSPQPGTRVTFPLVRLRTGKPIDLTGFDFDDLLT